MSDRIQVTAKNVELLEETAEILAEHLEELARKTRRYPVELEFGEYRFVFESRQDIERLIDMLRTETQSFRRAA